MMQMVGSFGEFELAMLKDRTLAGLDAARKEGRILSVLRTLCRLIAECEERVVFDGIPFVAEHFSVL
jgi:DNA invertase Pin-like site-specific DNA recombinase